MKENPLNAILDRDSAKDFIASNYRSHIELLVELANYGSNLVVRCYNSSKQTETEIVIIGHFLKQGVMLLDSVAEQLRCGCVIAAHINTRSLLENYALVKWIIQTDTDNRAYQFWVSILREKRLWARRSISDTDENTNFKEVFDRLGRAESDKYILENETSARKTCDNIDTILSDPKFSQINSAFDSARGNKTYEPLWYRAVNRNRSIKKIFEDVGMVAEYKTMYSFLSAYIHNSAMKSSITFSDGGLVFQPIRSPENLDRIISIASSNSLGLFRHILKFYRPAEVVRFAEKYTAEWRERHLNIPYVNVKAVHVDI